MFAGADAFELGADVGDGDAGEFGFEAGLGFGEGGFEDVFDAGADGAFVVGLEAAEAEVGLRFDGAVDVEEADVFGGGGEGEAAGGAFLGVDEASFDEGGEEAADDDGVGVHAGGDFGRRGLRTGFVGEVRQHVHADGEFGVSSHGRRLRLNVTEIVTIEAEVSSARFCDEAVAEEPVGRRIFNHR